MRIVLAIGLAAALVGCFGAGCAGEPAAEPEPVVRQSELRGAQAVREVVAIRTAGADAGVLSTKIFGTIAAAGRHLEQKAAACSAGSSRRFSPPPRRS
ncbi:MAG: hypothetical protein H0X21_02625, partial [Actinobacteria bacterium]|nr:hypothetical protein [Actinomycetota bacterium]